MGDIYVSCVELSGSVSRVSISISKYLPLFYYGILKILESNWELQQPRQHRHIRCFSLCANRSAIKHKCAYYTDT